MGLLDSPYVGRLVKKGTFTATKSSSAYLLSGIDIASFNTISFKITINSGTLDGDTSYIDFRGNITNNTLNPLVCYRIDNNNNISSGSKKLSSSGSYCSQDLSAFNYGGFYITTSSEVSVTIDYVLSVSTFPDIVNSMKIDNLTKPAEQLLYTGTANLSSTGNTHFNLPDTITPYSAIRINVVFNQADNDVVVIPRSYIGSVQSNGTLRDLILLREDGIYIDTITADSNLKYNYYLDYIPKHLAFRCKTAGAAGLTATINIYAIAKDSVPSAKHIQELFFKEYSNSTSEQEFTCALSEKFKMFKFFYCYVGYAYKQTGTVTKNYVTSEEDDSDTILSFSTKKIAVTKWLPITAITGAEITFAVTGSVNTGKSNVAIYGVV